MVVTYEYYAEYYGGHRIPESSWKEYANKVEARLKRYTFENLIESWPSEAKMAACEMAECLYQHSKRDGKISENNDGCSVSYDVSKSLDSKLYDIAKIYLANTGLMDV